MTNKHLPVREKAEVNISVVHGQSPPAAVKQMRADNSTLPYDPELQASLPFFAAQAGLSPVAYLSYPSAPTVHVNYRYCQLCQF